MAVKASAQITMTDVTDIDSTCRYYLLQSSTLSKPSKPTTNPPSSSWTKTEPSYTAGSTNSLYFTDLTVYSNGEFSYSDVSLSSSYEAAKAAYNKAVAAQNAANTAQSTANNAQTSANNAQSSATAAAKIATNYIDYSSTNGLQVGNKTSGSWSGFRTQITSSAFNILNAAGEILASYGAKVVELGKNASDAVIRFCGGKAYAGIGAEGDFEIVSDKIALMATSDDECDSSATSWIRNDEYGMQGWAITGASYRNDTFLNRTPKAFASLSAEVYGISNSVHNAAGIDVMADKDGTAIDIGADVVRVNGNALPIIETGTWTPVVDGFATTNTAIGNYLRIGDTVIIEFYVNGVCASWVADSTGFMNITGVPFTPLGVGGRYWYTGGGHWQGGVSNVGAGSFSGYVLQVSNKAILPRLSYYNNAVTAQYVRPQEGASVYASGTIMYKIAS